MKTLKLNATGWRSVADFYDSLLSHLGAPEWHGRNVNALVDSVVYGGINRVNPPFVIRIERIGSVPEDARQELAWAMESIGQADGVVWELVP